MVGFHVTKWLMASMVVFIGFETLTADVAYGIEKEQQPFSAVRYKEIIVRQRSKIRSMRGTYTFSTQVDPPLNSGLLRDVARKGKSEFAWAGEKRMCFESFERVGKDQKLLKSEATNVYNGKEFRRRLNRVFYIQDAKLSYSEQNSYLNSLRWPMTESELALCKTKPAECNFLPYCLEANDWNAQPRREIIRGVSCIVLVRASRAMRLWVDPEHGYSLLRLECLHPVPGQSWWINEYYDYRQCLPGVFFPMRVITRNHCEAVEKIPAGTLVTEIKVEELKVNDVPDSYFTLEPKIGDQVVDLIHKQQYVYAPVDDSTLETSVERVQVHVATDERHRWLFRFLQFGLGIIAAFGIVYGIIRILRVYRKKHSPS